MNPLECSPNKEHLLVDKELFSKKLVEENTINLSKQSEDKELFTEMIVEENTEIKNIIINLSEVSIKKEIFNKTYVNKNTEKNCNVNESSSLFFGTLVKENTEKNCNLNESSSLFFGTLVEENTMNLLDNLSIDKELFSINLMNENKNSLLYLIVNEIKIIKIQKWYRGCILRLKQLPLIMYKIKKYLKIKDFKFSNQNEDGRINSSIDEEYIIKLLIEKFSNKIKKPKIRMWYDILAFDYIYGWIPINIKTTTTITCDNTGNLAMCVYAYTDEILDICIDKSYENGMMSVILFNKLKNKKYNRNNKKDYYFVVLNKTDTSDIIVNSVKGLTLLTSNINNLPFQVNWSKNKNFNYENINKKIKMFIKCLQNPKPSWKETFMSNIRTLDL
jgi:hypothetical protein